MIASGSGCIPGGLPFQDARDRILGLVDRLLSEEAVPLAFCVGRVLSQPIIARIDLPGFDQAAMDGYAVHEVGAHLGTIMPVTGRTAAGEPPSHLALGSAHRILTGAPLPAGSDTVIPQENIRRNRGLVTVTVMLPAGANVRRRGEDVRSGTELISAGTKLDWRHIAILAAQGIDVVQVRRRVRVTLLSSGRELCNPGEAPTLGQIYDSNLPMLSALLVTWGADVRAQPVITDAVLPLQEALENAAEGADLVLTTAGISVGDEDHMREALQALGGDLAVLKVAMKPGKPLAAGRLQKAIFIGLPGNPQAALAGAVGFVQPLLARMAGTNPAAPLCVRSDFFMRRKLGRTEFVPVRLTQRKASIWAMRTGLEGSARLAPLLTATGFALLEPSTSHVEQGDFLDVLPFLPESFV